MAFNDPHRNQPSYLYPQVNQSNPYSHNPFSSYPMPNPTSATTSTPLYPSLDVRDLADNLVPDNTHHHTHTHNIPIYGPNSPSASAPLEPISYEETLITVPGAIVHLIDKHYSVELACGDFSIFRLWQGENIVAVLARITDEVQWPLMKDQTSVKVDESHYFFSLRTPKHGAVSDSSSDDDKQKKGKTKSKRGGTNSVVADDDDILNYGLSFAMKGQGNLLLELDQILAAYSAFSIQSVSEKSKEGVLDGSVAREISPEEMKKSGKKREAMERRCGAYWTTLAPNVEDYSGSAAKVIASGSGYMIKGILWCGDVTVDRLKWGNEVLVRRLERNEKRTEISPQTRKRLKRAKRMTKMTEKVAVGVLSGVLKVSGYFTSSVVNSKVGKKFFSYLPGEILLASLDGFHKICDAVEVAGRNVMSTSNTVTTGVVTHKYGEEAGKATKEGLGAAGHAFGAAWAAYKVRKALNPKGALKTSSLATAKAVAEDHKKSSKKSSK